MRTCAWMFGFVIALQILALPLRGADAKLVEGPLADDGRFRLAFGAQVEDGALTVTTDAAEWHDYLATAPDEIVLIPGSVYRVSYDYQVTHDLTGDQACFYHLFRADRPGANDRGWETFTGKTGDQGTRRFVAKLGDLEGYRLILGVRFAGGVRISNLEVEEVVPGPGLVLAPPLAAGDGRLHLAFGARVVDDAVVADTTGVDTEWHEYLHTVPAQVLLAAGRRYKVSYDYEVTKALSGNGASFYHLLRSLDDPDQDVGNRSWNAPVGSKGHKEFVAKLAQADRYYLILGIRRQGAVRITNLQIEDLGEER